MEISFGNTCVTLPLRQEHNLEGMGNVGKILIKSGRASAAEREHYPKTSTPPKLCSWPSMQRDMLPHPSMDLYVSMVFLETRMPRDLKRTARSVSDPHRSWPA